MTFVLGGASSGKSDFAERLAERSGLSKVYVATAQAFDDEMRQKIEDHKRGRGDDWRTVEASLDAAQAIADAASSEVIVMDCATLWLSNHLLADHDTDSICHDLLEAIAESAATVIVVSNEVGLSVVPENALARRFRSAQGSLNRMLAAQADVAVLIAAGLPVILKGTLPKGVR